MAAVSGTNDAAPYQQQQAIAEEKGFCDWVIDHVVYCWNAVTEKVVNCWNAIVRWGRESWTGAEYGFWRVAAHIAPSWGPWLEHQWLWVRRIFSDMQEISLRDEINELRRERGELIERNRQNTAERIVLRAERDRLNNENELCRLDIRHLNERIVRLTDDHQQLERINGDLQGEIAAMRGLQDNLQEHLNIARHLNQPLGTQVQGLIDERDDLGEQLRLAMDGRQLNIEVQNLLDADGNPVDLQALQRTLGPINQELFNRAFGHLQAEVQA